MITKKTGQILLREAFTTEQQVLSVQLELSARSISHPGTMGEVNEQYLISFLKRYLPNRYVVDKAIVIDSDGRTSDQIDIVIYDRQYTPTLLDQQSHRFVPAEAVYAIFEAKPTINKGYIEYAAEKAKSVRKLKRTSIPIKHAGGEYPAKPLFSIISGIIASRYSWRDGFRSKAFEKIILKLQDDNQLDCGLAVSGSCFDYFDKKYIIGPSKQALAFFTFRLLSKLQSLGTVPAIDWNAYASVLSNPPNKSLKLTARISTETDGFITL